MHGLYGIDIGGTVLPGILAQQINLNDNIRNEARAGDVYPRVVSMVAQGPDASFRTTDLTQGFTLIPASGLNLATLGGGLKMYAQKHADGGTREPAAAHNEYAFVKGLCVPRMLSCDHQGDAELSADVLATWDGTNDPVVKTENAAVPAAVAETVFTIGPIKLAGVDYTGFRGIQVDFGLAAVREGADSEIWDRQSRINRIQPIITFNGIDLDWWKATGGVPTLGAKSAHADTEIFFRKREAGGTFVADTALEHVKLTASGLLVIESGLDASPETLAEARMRLVCDFDGTNEPIIVAVNQQIAAA